MGSAAIATMPAAFTLQHSCTMRSIDPDCFPVFYYAAASRAPAISKFLEKPSGALTP
jgi:hypothetical protein